MAKTTNLPVNTGYARIREYYTNEEFNKRFFNRLFTDLSKCVGEDLASDYFKSIPKRIGIVNKETFYSSQVPLKEDIGIRAFKKTGEDLLMFCQEVLVNMQREKDLGKEEIDLTTVFIMLSHFKSNYQHKFGKRINKNRLETVVKSIVSSSITSYSNPFKIQILPPRLFDKVVDRLGLGSGQGYLYIIKDIFDVLYEYKSKKETVLPRLEIVLPIYSDLRNNQIKFLANVFHNKVKRTREIVENVPDLGEESPQLLIALGQLQEELGYYLKNSVGGIITELQRMKNENTFISYNGVHDSYDFFNVRYGLKRSLVREFNVSTLYVEEDSFIASCYDHFSKVRINCKDLSIDQVERYVNIAAEISMLRLRGLAEGYSRLGVTIDPILSIELGEVGKVNKEIIDGVKKIENKVRSKYNRNFVLSLFFNQKAATEKFGNDYTTHIRVISDIHADVNESAGYVFNFGNDLVINCGDTSGSYVGTKNWIRSYIRKGINVAGNHLGYSYPYPQLTEYHPINSKNVQLGKLLETFKYNPNIHFLSNSMVEYEGIIFLGGTLHTDFKLFGEKNQVGCIVEANKGLNDFRLCTFTKYSKEEKGYVVRKFGTEDHLRFFKYCYSFLSGMLKRLRKNGNRKPIVIVTHHAPTPYSVAEEYKNSPLSAAFASDLRDLILDYPEIRLWCHGHTHNCFDYIYGKTRVVCEPFGYFNENGLDVKNYGKRISLVDIKSKKSWEQILKDDIMEGRVKVEG